jgi:hypothetical protein
LKASSSSFASALIVRGPTWGDETWSRSGMDFEGGLCLSSSNAVPKMSTASGRLMRGFHQSEKGQGDECGPERRPRNPLQRDGWVSGVTM